MPNKLFPLWCGALFSLFPLSMLLFLPASALSCLGSLALVCALAASATYLAVCFLRPLFSHSSLLRSIAAILGLLAATDTLLQASSFFQHMAFWDAPFLLPLLFLLAVSLLLLRLRLPVLAMWSVAVFAVSAVLLLAFIALTFSAPHAGPPLPQFLFPPSLWSFTARLFLPALALAVLLPQSTTPRAAALGFGAGSLLFLLFAFNAVWLLGEHTIALLPYPLFSAAGLAALSDFGQHGETLLAAQLMLCCCGKIAALLSPLLTLCRSAILSLKKERQSNEYSNFR